MATFPSASHAINLPSWLERVFLALAAAVIVALVVAAVMVSQQNLRLQGAASVREAILNAALQCAAVEGSFPSTIQHLEDNYGLRVNRNDYRVTYECFASNVTPSVTVVPR